MRVCGVVREASSRWWAGRSIESGGWPDDPQKRHLGMVLLAGGPGASSTWTIVWESVAQAGVRGGLTSCITGRVWGW